LSQQFHEPMLLSDFITLLTRLQKLVPADALVHIEADGHPLDVVGVAASSHIDSVDPIETRHRILITGGYF
jgi:hypothetical protein